MSATFFGEVNEVSSRAVYWSEDEEEEERVCDVDVQSLSVVLSVDNDVLECQHLMISLTKNDTPISGLSQIGHASVDGNENKLAIIYGVNEKVIWIALNESHHLLKCDSLSFVCDSLVKQVISKYPSNTEMKPLVMILSRDVSHSDSNTHLNYLSNTSCIPSELTIKGKAMLAPMMLDNLVESSLFMYFHIHNVPCIAIKMTRMDVTLIPKPILASFKEFSISGDSNIFI